MTSNGSLAAWRGFPVSTALTARLARRVLLSPAKQRGWSFMTRDLVSQEDL
jgi:hypothetical protein